MQAAKLLPSWSSHCGTLVPWGATFHPELSAERCKGCHEAIPVEFQLLEKPPRVTSSSTPCWLITLTRGLLPCASGKAWFLPFTAFKHWSGCNLDASCVLSVMRDFCKYPLNFCSFNIWKIFFLVFFLICLHAVFPPGLTVYLFSHLFSADCWVYF